MSGVLIPIIFDLDTTTVSVHVNMAPVGACLWVRALLNMLSASRAALKLDVTLSDRFSSMTHLHVGLNQAQCAMVTAIVVVCGRTWTAIAGLLGASDNSWTAFAFGELVLGLRFACPAASLFERCRRGPAPGSPSG